MTKETMIKNYRKFSAADSYILGFCYNKDLYMVKVQEIMPRFLTIEEASRNQGYNLRLRIRKPLKEQLLKNAICIGKETDLISDKYNKGEIFEKIVTELYGLKWVKDTVPFTQAGDIRVNDEEIQIKLDSATLVNTKLIEKLKRG